MSDPAVERIRIAEARALAARADLTATVHAIQERLTARSLIRQATDAGSEAAQRGVDAVRRNPGALAGAVALAGLFLGRHRIAALFPIRRQVNRPGLRELSEQWRLPTSKGPS